MTKVFIAILVPPFLSIKFRLAFSLAICVLSLPLELVEEGENKHYGNWARIDDEGEDEERVIAPIHCVGVGIGGDDEALDEIEDEGERNEVDEDLRQ